MRGARPQLPQTPRKKGGSNLLAFAFSILCSRTVRSLASPEMAADSANRCRRFPSDETGLISFSSSDLFSQRGDYKPNEQYPAMTFHQICVRNGFTFREREQVSWSLLILVLREKGNQSRLPIEMDKIDDTKKANDWCFSVNGLYHKAMIMQTNTLDDFSNTSGTEDFQQQKQLANSSLIQCDRQMGHSRANVIVLATSEKLLSISIFYIANAAFVLASLR
ncbi:hypothetical protein YC2023_067270 [Brassica napus]